MAQREVKDWITVNHKHIPIYEGESKADAVNREMIKANESKKAKEIAQNKERAKQLTENAKTKKPPKEARIVATYDKTHRPSKESFDIKSLGDIKDSLRFKDFMDENIKNNPKFEQFAKENGKESVRQLWYEYRRQKELKDLQKRLDENPPKTYADFQNLRDEYDLQTKKSVGGKRMNAWDKWFWDSDSRKKPVIADDLVSKPGVLGHALAEMYYSTYIRDLRKEWINSGHTMDNFKPPLSFKEWLNTPMKLYRGTRGQKYIDSDVFTSYTPMKQVAIDTAKGDKTMVVYNKKGRGRLHTMTVKPIDTWGMLRTGLGEDEILIPRGIMEMSKARKDK